MMTSYVHYTGIQLNTILLGIVEKELINGLLKECGRMYEFNHPNVLKLLGVCLDGGPAPLIVMPFMTNGSLNTYLKKERDSVVLDPDSTKPDDAVICTEK